MTHPHNHLQSEYSRCRRGNRCIYGFPKPITTDTYVDDDGHVHLRTRTAEDQWIASHIPELVNELNCHIFVDIVFTVAVFMYLYKYMFKGPDHSQYQFRKLDNQTNSYEQASERKNEVKDYVDGRYLSSPEAAWRILNFQITMKNPTVRALTVHLPGQNIPKFLANDTTSSLIRYFHRPPLPQFTNLTYIDYNQQYIPYPFREHDPLAEDEYLEIPIAAVPVRKIRKRRTKKNPVARIQTISPTAGELFYLRCLLMHRPARSYEDLRTFGHEMFTTFHEAAIHLGLFTTADEGFYAMEEAVSSLVPPSQLRFLFARIILEGYPARPLWDTYQHSLSLDFIHKFHSTEQGVDHTLQQIAEYIQDSGRSLADFGLPQPLLRSPEVVMELEAFENRLDSLEREAAYALSLMNIEQQQVLHSVYDNIEKNHCTRHPCQPMFIDGRPGRGKTFVVDAIIKKLRSEGKIVLTVGTSALAASLHERGRTAHSLFEIPVTDVRTIHLLHIGFTNKFFMS